MERGKVYRRHQAARYKARAFKVSQRWWGGKAPSPRIVGLNYATRCKPCSCYMCGNRRSLEGPTRAERLSALVESEEWGSR